MTAAVRPPRPRVANSQYQTTKPSTVAPRITELPSDLPDFAAAQLDIPRQNRTAEGASRPKVNKVNRNFAGLMSTNTSHKVSVQKIQPVLSAPRTLTNIEIVQKPPKFVKLIQH